MDSTALLLLLGFLFVTYLVVSNGRDSWIWRILNRARKTPDAPKTEPENVTVALHSIALNLAPFYNASARPPDLRSHPDFQEGVRLLLTSAGDADALLGYFFGDNPLIACLAAEALRERGDPGAVDGIISAIGRVPPWPLFFALDYLAAVVPPRQPIVGRVLARIQEEHWRTPVFQRWLVAFARARQEAGEKPTFGRQLDTLSPESATLLEQFLGELRSVLPGQLLLEFVHWKEGLVDDKFLASIGSVWPQRGFDEKEGAILHPGLRPALQVVENALLDSPSRSVLLVGALGVGKTALASAVARSLSRAGWVVFEASPAALVAGQKYFGEFEQRLRDLVARLSGRRVLWLIPEFHALVTAGRHEYSQASALDLLLPLIERGEVRVVGETEAETYERLVRAKPAVATSLTVMRIEPASETQTKSLATQWIDAESEVKVADDVIDEAWELAQQYLQSRAAPGNVLRLLNRTARRLSGGTKEVPLLRKEDLLLTLSEITGIPTTILDERERLDLHELGRLFGRRVLGQPSAVSCLVERVAMIKAGVTDPTRPYGVFLFAGPTGTGKTEAAKTLSEFLFGSSERMIRLDMSEYQTPESLDGILGRADHMQGEAFVDRVRKQPFSVILLDEFEKAHERVRDLFLQVFDDGRLTSRRGDTADFRHSIIILTSNLGGTIPTGTSLGFGGRLEEFNSRSVIRTVEQSFRRELINRLDRIVVFQPLSRPIMREILQNELGAVFQRRGLRSRGWAVEWDERAVEFLLEKGFSKDLGARPLKRSIEQHLLAPLSMAIVEHQYPEGDQFLFVSSSADKLAVTFVDPNAAPESPAEEPPSLASPEAGPTVQQIALRCRGTPAELQVLEAEYYRLAEVLDGKEWEERRSAALGMTQFEDFWSAPDRFEVLGQIECQDRVASALKRAGSLLRRLLSGSGSAGRDYYPKEPVAVLAQRLYLIEQACTDVLRNRPREAFVLVEAVGDGRLLDPETRAFAAELGQMYLRWGEERGMRIDILERTEEEASAVDRLLLSVTGFGSFTLLEGEAGLHVFERPTKDGSGFDRSRVRVRVVPQAPVPPDLGADALCKAARRLLLNEASTDSRIVRRYRREPSPLVRDSVRGWRTGRIDQVLGGDFDLIEST